LNDDPAGGDEPQGYQRAKQRRKRAERRTRFDHRRLNGQLAAEVSPAMPTFLLG